MSETQTANHQKYVQPLLTFFSVVWLFLDVLTLIVRLLFNVLMHDSPHGENKELISGEPGS